MMAGGSVDFDGGGSIIRYADGSTMSASVNDSASGSEDDSEGGDDVELSDRAMAAASQQPYVDVRLDTHTGLLHLSVYVNGDASGDGATFLRRSVAGCLDNYRWLILDGQWKGHVLFFITEGTRFAPGSGAADVTPSRCEGEVRFLVIQGVCFERRVDNRRTNSPTDPYACTRCGHVRRQHNALYVSRRTGALARGKYYCWVCRRTTPHLRVPASVLRQVGDAERVLASSMATSTSRPPRGPSARSAAGRQVHGWDSTSFLDQQTSLGGRSRTPVLPGSITPHARLPPWRGTGRRLNETELLGRVPFLSTPPVRPRSRPLPST